MGNIFKNILPMRRKSIEEIARRQFENLMSMDTPFTSDYTRSDVKNHIWVTIAINILSRCIMRAEYLLYESGEQKTISGWSNLFDVVGGNTPSSTLFLKSMKWWGWEGEFFWYWGTDYGYGVPNQIIVLDPRRVNHTVMNGKANYYYTDGNGKAIELKEGEFLHVMYPNVHSEVRGVFPLYSSGMNTLLQDRLIQEGNTDALRNGSIPDVVLKSKLRLSPDQAKDMTERWTHAYGRKNNASRVAAIGNNTDVQVMNQDLIKYVDLLDWNRTTILAAYGIPLKVANAETERTALSGKDSDEQYRAMWSQTIKPTLAYWEGEINRQLFTSVGYPKISGKFNLDKVPELQEDENRVSERYRQEIESGMMTINEVRELKGLSRLPWGDVWWKPTRLESMEDDQ
jgi:HK97 family phage portal protein